MKKEENKFCFLRKGISILLSTVFLILMGCPSAEGKILSIQGKEGFPYFDQQSNLSLVYVNTQGGISIAAFERDNFRERMSIQDIYHGDNIGSLRIKKDKQGKTWLLWEEREYEKSDIHVARLLNKTILQPINVTSSQTGFNFSPCMDFSFRNDLWIVWVNYFQKEYAVLAKNMNTGQTWTIYSSLTSSACSPQIIIDGNERVWIFWVAQLRNHDEILCAHFNGQRWSNTLSLDQNPNFPHVSPSVSLDSNGLPHIVWSAFDGHDYELFYSHWNGVQWTPEERITNNHHIADTSPSLSLFLSTIPMVAWLKYKEGKRQVCLTIRNSERWTNDIILSGEQSVSQPPKLVSSGERIGVLWQVESEIRTILLHFYELYEPLPLVAQMGGFSRIQALDRDKYIGFGNSITYGVINDEGAPEKGYIPRLEGLIDTNIAESQVINRGIGGEKTAEGLSRIHSVINEGQAQTIFLMEGTNDAKDYEISMDTAGYNLRKMAESALDLGMDIFIASIIPFDPWEGLNEERVLDLNQKIQALASDLSIPFVDQFTAFGGYHSGFLYYSDATHPNEQGYQLMAETWYEALVDTLPSIDIDQDSLSFIAKLGGANPSPQIFKIKNAGAGLLEYQISDNQDWLYVSPTSGDSRREWDEIEVSVDISQLSWGSHQGEITIASEYTPNSPQTVIVELDISTPTIELNKISLSFEAVKGKPAPSAQTFKIKNSGEGILKFQISVDEDWISVSPTIGDSSGEWDEIKVSVDISSLSRGSYEGKITVSAENTSNSPQVITVHLTVSSPIITVDTTSLSFEGLKGEPNPPSQAFKIRNSGEDSLNYQISDNRAWITVSPISGKSSGEWDEIKVSVDISSLSRGSYEGKLMITAENASNSPQVITVHLTVYGPEIGLNKSSLSFRGIARESNPPSQGFKIKNSKEGKLIYQISVDEDWISVSPASGNSSGEWDFIEVAVDISQLGEGSNQAQIIITAPDSSNSPQILNISLHIQFPPLFPPSNFSGEKRENRSLSQIEYINVLTWEVNPQNKFIQKYKIYLLEDGGRTLLGETDAQTFQYWHRKVEKDRAYRYELRAQDEFGRESAPAVTDVR